MGDNNLTRATDLAKTMVKTILKKGDIVIDGTMGNGNDTLFLTRLVGKEGKVFSFDVQKLAIENTKRLLQENGVYDFVSLIHDGHENVDQYVMDEIAGAMFNLGYLPKGDHNIVTKPKTTIISIGKCLGLLKKGGMITIVIYYGHLGGEMEKEEILHYVENLDPSQFHVLKMEYINQKNQPPILIGIIKK